MPERILIFTAGENHYANDHLKAWQLMNLSELKPGQRGIIEAFTDLELSIKLMEMGCLPGSTVVLERIAPLGDPIAITVAGYQLSLRMEEACTILIERGN